MYCWSAAKDPLRTLDPLHALPWCCCCFKLVACLVCHSNKQIRVCPDKPHGIELQPSEQLQLDVTLFQCLSSYGREMLQCGGCVVLCGACR